jgi:DNA-binding NarL/FixJ family response regulator
VYPQCVPQNGDVAHLLSWPEAPRAATQRALSANVSAIELAILVDAANGMTMVESANRRVKSRETVKTQRKSVLLKLGAKNMTHAVAIAARAGLIDSPSEAG